LSSPVTNCHEGSMVKKQVFGQKLEFLGRSRFLGKAAKSAEIKDRVLNS
jgi:hypothetical protein